MGDVIFEVVSASAEETLQLGRRLSALLQRGDCVALYGDLGSGKTHFAKGICAGLHATDPVTSPTFALLNEYAGVGGDGNPMPIYHFDLYRLGDADELLTLGADDFFYGTGVCLIEWADLGGTWIPGHAYRVYLEYAGESVRKILAMGRTT